MAFGNDPVEMDFILEDAGVPVIVGDVLLSGLVEPEEFPVVSSEGFGASVNRVVLLVRPATWPSTAVADTTITVDGVTYYVREKGLTREDGLLPITIAKEPG
jgi:hypothetical protein